MSVRKLKKPRIKVEIETGTVSKYFVKQERRSVENVHVGDENNTAQIERIKAMDSDEYFAFIDKTTNDEISAESKVAYERYPNVPANFFPIYSKVKLMRSKIKTPVDNVGCAMLPITINDMLGVRISEIKPKNYRLQLLLSLMLSSQTKDETTAKAMHNLMEYCIAELNDPDGITLDSLLSIDEKALDKEIYSVGFHNRKTSYIKKAALLLRDNFEGDVPTTIEGYMSLPGVGPKMGYLALQKSWAKIDGIGVDVHVDRLAKMWKWVDPKLCKTPEHTRKQLESWLPKPLWYELNPVLVGFGQVICMPRAKKCNICLVNDICPGVDKKILKENKDYDNENSSIRGDLREWVAYLRNQTSKDDSETLIKSDNNATKSIRIKKEL